ncbi:MAG TPA: serine/threonine-protein kinase [Thermoleophilaceae bacterium]|nr:serine/threonine-protein kinase [Thermoleophilaceae bacterium]
MGPYDVDRLISRGGMGEVYLARHRHLDRQVALKILPAGLAGDQGFRERFVRESRSAAALHHPNIVTVYDAGETDGVLYIAMQYIDGPDLSTVLHRDGPLPAARCMLILDQIAAALEAAHARGLIHRDVKPGNVLLDTERAYLTDFGLTKPVGVNTAVTSPGVLVGTVDYVAPEQIRGGAVDPRTDVYALGCLMYRALTGTPPFPRDNEMAVLHAHLYDEPPRVTDLRPDLPPAIDDVIWTALAKDPEDRFGSATAVSVAANHAMTRRIRASAEAPTGVVSHEVAPETASRPSGPTARLGRTLIPGLPSAGVAAALVLLGAAVVIVLVVTSQGNGGGAPPAPTASLAPADLEAAPPTRVGYLPSGVAVGLGGIYVANEGDGTLRRVDAIKGRLDSMKTIIGGGPAAVAAGADGVWVTSRHTNMLTRVDPRTMSVVARIPVGSMPGAVAIGNHDYAVWVANEKDATVVRVNPRTNTVDPAKPIAVGRAPHAIATTPGAVFVANRSDGTVDRIDVRSRRVTASFKTGKRPTALTVSGKFLWVANAGDGSVARIDMHSSKVVGRTHVGGQPSALVSTDSYVYVADRKRQQVKRLNPVTGRLEGKAVRVRDPVAMRVGAGALWIANRATGNLTRIGLL